MNNIKVSACIIAYNHESFISKCIEGAINQKVYFEYEIIIGEDNSQDNTREICEKYANNYPDLIKYYPREKNLGMVGNWINTIKDCKGKYIALCEGDDYWTDPLKLQKQVDFMEENPEFVMCFTNTKMVDKKGNITRDKIIEKAEKDVFTTEDLTFFAPTLTRLMRNSDFSKLPNDFYKVKGADTYLAAWQSQFGKTKFLDFVSSAYRQHEGGIFSSLNAFNKHLHIINSRLAVLNLFPYHKKVQVEAINRFSMAGNELSDFSIYSKYVSCFFKVFKKVEKENKIELFNIFKKKTVFFLKLRIKNILRIDQSNA